MAKVLGVGGVFFKARDQATLRDWYARVLGLSFEPWGGVIFTPDAAAKQPGAATTFSSFRTDSNYFAPSAKEFMINLMVDDLTGMLARCAQNGVTPIKVMNDEPNGRFAHIVDPEGLKIELWEPAPLAAK